jgi:ribonuclease D
MPSPTIVASPEALEELATQLTASDALALDTEFMRERTYRAELCLLQIGAAERMVCVDPLALPALEPLRAAFASAGTVKVLHAARQDLEVLQPAVGQLGNVFDTQVAAALAGFAAQVGYGELVRTLLGTELPKAQTRTDWSRRPLSAEQIDYALDDVRYLLPLRERLLEKLAALGRLDWLSEEFSALQDPTLLAVDPERAWLRVRSLQSLDEDRARLAQSVAAWRERRAISRNRPRGWILDDNVMREIIVRVPRDRAALSCIPDMPEGVVKHSGEELLTLIANARIPDPPPPLPRREKPDPAHLARVKQLADTTQAVANQLAMAPEILATRRDLERIARGDTEVAPLRGWRSAAIGDALRARL